MDPLTVEELARLLARQEERLAEAERRLAALEAERARPPAAVASSAIPAQEIVPDIAIAAAAVSAPVEPEPAATHSVSEFLAHRRAVPPPLPPKPAPIAAEVPSPEEPVAVASLAEVAPAPEPPANAEPVATAAPVAARVGAVEFMTEEEFSGTAATTVARDDGKPAVEFDFETFIARWLPLVGGLLVTVGAGIFATVVDSPIVKVGIGYVLCAAIGACGMLAMRRAPFVGRGMVAVALSLAYFVSFASHYVPQSRVFPAAASIALMIAFAGGLFGLAERWKSQLVAGMGLALGILAALISSSTSQSFALVALSLLAAGSGWLLVRHEWKTLTALSLCGTYLGTALLWFLLPVDAASGDPLVHTFALAFYHATFVAAFWKWGRIWAARERAAEEAAKHESLPAVDIRPSVYASAGATLNSLFLAGLSVWLWWRTQSLWPSVHWLLFALAGLEVGRLALRGTRRSLSVGFHAALALALASCGVAAAFSGLAESAVMAALAAAIAVAATRLPLLRWLKPLTAVCAGVAVYEFARGGLAVATPADLLHHLLPAAFLFASCLAWERLLPGDDREPHLLLRIAEGISGQLRGVMAAGMALAALGDWLGPNQAAMARAFAALAVALSAGIVGLRASAWRLGAFVAAAAMFVGFMETHRDGAGIVASHGVAMLALFWLWGEGARRAIHPLARAYYALVAVASAVGFLVFWGAAYENAVAWPGLALLGTAAGFGSAGAAFLRLPRLGCIARGGGDATDAAPWLRLATPALASAALAACIGAAMVVAVDARVSLLPAAVPAIVVLGLAIFAARGGSLVGSAAGYFVATGIFLPAVVVYGNGRVDSMLAATALAAVLLVAGLATRGVGATVCGGVWMAVAPIAALAGLANDRAHATAWELYGVGIATLVVLAALASKVAARRIDTEKLRGGVAPLLSPETAWWFCGAGAAAALAFLAAGDLLPTRFVTPSWGLVGATMLAIGLAANVAPMRFVALGVFACAIGRVFLHDLAGASGAAKAIAFLALGVLLLGAGFAYVFRRKLAAK